MKYDRLTVKDTRTGRCERIGDPTTSAVYYINDRSGRYSLDEEVITKRISFKEAYNRLAELEDKIENGRLVELPIPLGTELHFLHSHEHADRPISPTIHSTNKWSFEIWGNGKSGISSDDIPCGYYGVYRHKFGDTVFLTRAEAERKIKELNGE